MPHAIDNGVIVVAAFGPGVYSAGALSSGHPWHAFVVVVAGAGFDVGLGHPWHVSVIVLVSVSVGLACDWLPPLLPPWLAGGGGARPVEVGPAGTEPPPGEALLVHGTVSVTEVGELS